MHDDHSTDDRLAKLERDVAYLTRLLEKATRYAASDPEVALFQARKSAEAICRRLFEAEIGRPGKMMLEELMQKLQAKRVLPYHVVVPLRTIQDYGNYGVHPQEQHVEVSGEWVSPCLSALAQVTNWYFTEYLRMDVPAALQPIDSSEGDRPASSRRGDIEQPARDAAAAGTAKPRASGRSSEASNDRVRTDGESRARKPDNASAGRQHDGRERPADTLSEHKARPVLINGRYEDLGDGTVRDTKTGLQWMRCALGQRWDGSTCVGEADELTWDEMFAQIDVFNRRGGFVGHRDWRAPTIDELKTLVLQKGRKGRSDDVAFPNLPAYPHFWSSSPIASDSDYARLVSFFNGNVNGNPGDKGSPRYVRLVRGGQ